MTKLRRLIPKLLVKLKGPLSLQAQDFGVALLVFGLAFGTASTWIHFNHNFRDEEQQLQTQQTALIHASVFELNLQRSLSAAKILGSYVEIKQGDSSGFEQQAQVLLESLGGITNLQLAPDGIITQIYPPSGHEAALGHNLIKQDSRRTEALTAIRDHRMTVAGPFELIQGGTAIVARYPVFLPADTHGMQIENTSDLPFARQGDRQFWGFASVLIMFDDALAFTELDNAARQGFAYRIRRQHPDTGQWQVLAGQLTLPDIFVATSPIRLPNAVWQLDIAPLAPAVAQFAKILEWIAALLFAIVLSVLAVILVRRPRVLARLVELRTLELQRTQQELKEAKVRAEDASQAKSDFLAVMSHEIRTPLNGVLGLLELLADANLTPREASFLKTARESGEALLEVINDILDFSKMEAGQMQLEESTIETRKLVASVSMLMRPKATSKGLTLESNFSGEIPVHFTGDPGRVRQVLLNMTSNAVKYTGSGTICLEVHGQHIEDDRYRLLFSVTDTGIGIDLDHQPNLFERFATVDASYSRRYGGTGLGLSICRELVGLMGGTLGVDSRPGAGSRFWFELTVNATSPEGTSNMPMPPPASASIRPLKVLVVEDVVTNLLVIREMLLRAGHRVQMAKNGIEAIQALQIAPFDLVLMDLSMPEMDGLEATRAIRAMEEPASGVIIIAMTAHTFEEERTRCLEAGMNDYLTKPIDRQRLLATITHWFADKKDYDMPAGDDKAWQSLTESDAVDERTLAQLAEDIGVQRVPELVNIFIQDARSRLAQFEEALQHLSLDKLQREAHSLASSGATYGLPELHRLARTVEQACRDGDQEMIAASADQLILRGPILIDTLVTFMSHWEDQQPTAR
ncbi:hypothetical protein GCM10009104_31230 [Marinobacterium maritimum]|uniref:histidine kinase n=1 Tax=Marinobacterium maritimum TaxID=500162 RepID=A0ABN1I9P9_9GAMM